MFISNAEKQELKDQISEITAQLNNLSLTISRIEATLFAWSPTIEKISPSNAPYGFRKNGTPKSKPGPKGAKQ